MTSTPQEVCRILVAVGVQHVIALPDSLLAPLCLEAAKTPELDYIQTTHESTAIALAAGLNVCGRRAVVMMENSGLRSACETLARLNLSHHLFTCALISHRGAFGERNWWGLAHHETMYPLLDILRIRYRSVAAVSEVRSSLLWAFDTLAAGQCSVALIVEPGLTEALRGVK